MCDGEMNKQTLCSCPGFFISSGKRPCNVYPLESHFLYSKTGVCRGKPIFLIFAPKHRLCVPTIYVLSKNKKNIFKNPMKFSIFTGEKNLCILHGQVFIMWPAVPSTGQQD